jgi:hypothetical protein
MWNNSSERCHNQRNLLIVSNWTENSGLFSLPAQAFISAEAGRVIQVAAAEAAEVEVDEEEVFTGLELNV